MKTFTFCRGVNAVLLGSVLCFLCSCNKVTQAPPDPKLKKLLLKEIFSAGNTLYFSYDTRHRLTQCFGKDLNGIDTKCRFEYDDGNRLIRAYNDDYARGQRVFTFNYISKDSVKLTLTSLGTYPIDWMLTLDQKGRLIKTDFGYNATEKGLPLVSYITYGYNAAGNVSKVDRSHDGLGSGADTCLYDNQKTPFYNVVGLSSLFSLVFPDLLNGAPTNYVNNLVDLKDDHTVRAPGAYYGYKCIYQYDSDGFPISMDFKAGEDENYPIQYVYFNH